MHAFARSRRFRVSIPLLGPLFLITALTASGCDTAGTDEAGEGAEVGTEETQAAEAGEAMTETTVEDAAVAAIDQQIETAAVDTEQLGWRSQLPKPAVAEFDPEHDYFAHMQTNKGPIVIRFFPDVAPMHVTSFIYLSRLGFYDGLNFHRVITDFMAQGGDPLGTGTGDPGYEMDGEYRADVKHDRPGLLSAANAGPGTDGSQFFLTFKATPWLDGKHTIYGEVVEGVETLAALEAAGSQTGATSEPLVIETVRIDVTNRGEGPAS